MTLNDDREIKYSAASWRTLVREHAERQPVNTVVVNEQDANEFSGARLCVYLLQPCRCMLPTATVYAAKT